MNINLSEDQKKALGLVDERKDFYFKVENAAIDEDVFSDVYEAHLFIVLSRYCNKTGVAFPSVKTLAKKCYCSETVVRRSIKGLMTKGLLKKIERTGSDNACQTNLYAIQNINKYTSTVKEKEENKSVHPLHDMKGGTSQDEVGVPHEVKGGTSQDEPKEEIIKNNYIKQEIIKNKKEQEEKDPASLDENSFKKNITKIEFDRLLEQHIKENGLVKTPIVVNGFLRSNGFNIIS